MARVDAVKRRAGRPFRYKHILLSLDPDEVYTAASIALWARERGMLEGHSERTLKRSYTRVRITLGRLSRAKAFPALGDGTIELAGHPTYPGWFGWRWQAAVEK